MLRRVLAGSVGLAAGALLLFASPAHASAKPHPHGHHGRAAAVHHAMTHPGNGKAIGRLLAAATADPRRHRPHHGHGHAPGAGHGLKHAAQRGHGHGAAPAANQAPAVSTKHRLTTASTPRTQRTTTTRTTTTRTTTSPHTGTTAFSVAASTRTAAAQPAKRPAARRPAAPPRAAPAARPQVPAVVAPLRDLGDTIGKVPGFSVFGGPLGWVFTGLLLLGALMIVAALTLGRRRTIPTSTA